MHRYFFHQLWFSKLVQGEALVDLLLLYHAVHGVALLFLEARVASLSMPYGCVEFGSINVFHKQYELLFHMLNGMKNVFEASYTKLGPRGRKHVLRLKQMTGMHICCYMPQLGNIYLFI